MKFLLIQLFLLLSFISVAQGLLFDDAAYDQLKRLPNYGSKSGDSELLANTPKVDLKPFCPMPQHQGAIGSCTGWSTGYGAMTILRAMQRGWAGKTDTITQNALSALYLYNQARIGSCAGGAYISKAASLAKEEGSVLSARFDRFKNNCEIVPSVADSLAALPNRVKDFLTLFSSTTSGPTKIEKVRLSLARRAPVVVGVQLRKNFTACTAVAPYWEPTLGDTTYMGGHAMVVIGYDDGKQAFELLNSWGTQWGDGGFGWIRYTDFARYCTYAIQLVPGAPSLNRRQGLSAEFAATMPVYAADDALSFQPQAFRRNGSYYEPVRGVLPVGSLLRWQLPRVTRRSYLYAISFDVAKKIHVHWPRDAALDDTFLGRNESAIINLSQPNLFLPGEYGALRFGQAGTEYVCFLLSPSPIVDINVLVRRLSGQRGDFMQRLRRVFGDRLVGEERVRFSAEGPAFTAAVKPGEIVATVVRLNVE